jgi:phosphatidylinositol-4,5-bisphosphate 3-kinase
MASIPELTPLSLDVIQRIDSVLKKDSLYQLTEQEKKLIWQYHYHYQNDPFAVVKILQAVPWHDAGAVKEVHRMLNKWAPLNPYLGIELLDAKFADEKVREFGVYCLQQLRNEELAELLLQLVQALKYEPYHDSALARFLLCRALSNRRRVGHAFFWHLQADMQNLEISERYTLLAEAYLQVCFVRHILFYLFDLFNFLLVEIKVFQFKLICIFFFVILETI